MNKRKTFFWLAILIVVGIIIFLGIKQLSKTKVNEPDPYKIIKETRNYRAPKLTGIKWLNDDSWLLVTQKNTKLPETYYENDGTEEVSYTENLPIIGKEIILTTDDISVYTYKEPGGSERTTEIPKYLLNVYKVNSDKLSKEKTIDMNAVANGISEGFTAGTIKKLSYDEDYILFYIHKEGQSSDEEYYYFRLSDEKVLTKAEAPQDLVQKVNENIQNGEKPSPEYKNTTSKEEIVSLYPEAEKVYEKDEKATLVIIKNPPKVKEK